MTTLEGRGIGKYVAVYICLLVVFGLQVMIGYQRISGMQLAIRALTFGVIETILVVLFFMNMSSERPAFFRFVAIFMLFVMATVNIIWTDSFRLLLYHLTNIGPS
jgi:cytochrome c oxidase subunit IV